MNTVKTHWFWWWGWEPNKLISWLEEKEAQGCNLFQVGAMGLLFRFRKGEKRKISYGVDFQAKADDEYIAIFQEDSWELMWTGAGGWYL